MLFFHNSYVSLEFPDCGNLTGADCMENVRWANTDPFVHFWKTNTDPSVYFRKANMDPSMHFRKGWTGRDGRGFSRVDRAAPWDFPWASPSENPSKQPFSFTWIKPV